MKKVQHTPILTSHQLTCIEDVLQGLSFLKKELDNLQLNEFSETIIQCKNQITNLSLSSNTHQLPHAMQPDKDMILALEMLEKYASIKDHAIRQEVIQSIELMDNDLQPRYN